MRLKSAQLLSAFFVLVCAIQVQAGLFDWFGGGDDSSSSSSSQAASSTPVPASSSQSQASSPAPSSQAPASSSAAPGSSSEAPKPSSSATPSPTPSSTENKDKTSTSEDSTKETSSDNQSSESASASSSSPTATNQNSKDDGDNNNTAIIVGSVIGFVVVVGAAFGFAIFARKKRASRKQLYDDFHNTSPSNQNAALAYESRPSPAMAAAAVAAADDIHQQHSAAAAGARPWEAYDYHDQQQYAPYGQTAFSPQMPPATVTDQYYSQPMTHPVMNYPDAAISGAYYTHVPYQNNGQQYYDNTYNNYSPYTASPTPAPMQTPATATTAPAPIYSPPNAYDDNDAVPSPKPQNAGAPSPVPAHQMQEVHNSNKWQTH